MVGTLGGVAFLCAMMLSKTVFLGSDSANNYAHVWYISDRIFHHGRLPLHVTYLESGRALTFPYAIGPWIVTALPFALVGDRAVTFAMVTGLAFYGYAVVKARPALREGRLPINRHEPLWLAASLVVIGSVLLVVAVT